MSNAALLHACVTNQNLDLCERPTGIFSLPNRLLQCTCLVCWRRHKSIDQTNTFRKNLEGKTLESVCFWRRTLCAIWVNCIFKIGNLRLVQILDSYTVLDCLRLLYYIFISLTNRCNDDSFIFSTIHQKIIEWIYNKMSFHHSNLRTF